MIDFQALPLWANLLVFVCAGVVVWLAGVKLSETAENISSRTRLSRAFAGLLLLGFATSLPELATTVTAAVRNNPELAASNLMGGVSMQTAVLVLVDAVALRRALTYVSPQPVLLMQAVFVIMLLSLVIGGSVSGDLIAFAGLGLGSTIIFLAYLGGLYISQRYESRDRWRPVDPPDESSELREMRQRRERKAQQSSMRGLIGWFAAMCVVILISGYALAESADAIAKQTGIASGFIGATLLALATSLPEVSTSLSAARIGAYQMALSNIFGSNALDISQLFVVDIAYRGGPVLAEAGSSASFVAALGILLTCVYLAGLLERQNRSVLRMGWDSIAVAVLYVAGILIFYQLG